MQDNTLLTVCSEELLLKLIYFSTTHCEYKIVLNKSKTRRFSRCVPKTSIKTQLFILLTLDTILSTQIQEITLLTVCSERLLLKLSFFSLLMMDTNFSEKKQEETFLTMCTKKLLQKLCCLFYSPWIQFLSKQMQDNTLLTVCSEELLLKLICFSTTQCEYKNCTK